MIGILLLALIAPTAPALAPLPAALAAPPATAEMELPPDYPIAAGHFYTQAGGVAPGVLGASGLGFALTDDAQGPFWSAFRRYGGPRVLGYPISSRYAPDGGLDGTFVYQATQRGLLQADTRTGEVGLANVLDLLSAPGLDAELEARRQIPPADDWSGDQGRDWDAIVERHFALLDRAAVPAALRDAYLVNRDAIVQWGLPVGFRDFGLVAALRTQRAVLQWWREEVPWARAGDVSLVNLGDLLKELGLIPLTALTPLPGPPPVPRGTLHLEGITLVDTAGGTRLTVPLRPDQPPVTLLDTSSYDLAVAARATLEHPPSARLELRLAVGDEPVEGVACRGCEEPVARGDLARTLEIGPLRPRPGMERMRLAIALAAVEGEGAQLAQSSIVLPVEVLTGTAAAARRLRNAGFKALPAEQALALGVRELIASGESALHGSPPERVHNIRLAASKLNGVIVPAGATFSFLKELGEISKEAGYQEGLIIESDQTVPGVGGGVCQVSTTMFRAAFWAGLPIVQRHQHRYRVGYYEQHDEPVGFDAAVYAPWQDLKWTNDTGRPIVIQAEYDLVGHLYFKLYGVKPDRKVELRADRPANVVQAGPPLPDSPDPRLARGVRKQVEFAVAGMDTNILRLLHGSDGSERVDSFASKFVPWRARWMYGTR